MTETSRKRLSKAERREQLLEAALGIVRTEGTDALTLGHLAERAEVSKPIAYEHFGTRAGLLIALYKKLDEQQVAVLLRALERTPKTLDDVARVMSRAYMSCYANMGPEWHAISGALKGTGEMEAFQRELLDGYVNLYCEALAEFVKLPREGLRLRCVGIIGAAEAIASEMLAGRTKESRAASVLARMIVAALEE